MANQKICQLTPLPILIRKDGLGIIRDTSYLDYYKESDFTPSPNESGLFLFNTEDATERRVGIVNKSGVVLSYGDFHDVKFLNENYLALQHYTDFGLINLATYERTPIIFSTINMEFANIHQTDCLGDYRPIAIVSIQGHFGILDSRLRPIVPLEFDSISYHPSYGITLTRRGWQASTAITNIHNYASLKFKKIRPRSNSVNIGFTSDDAEELDYILKNGGDWVDD